MKLFKKFMLFSGLILFSMSYDFASENRLDQDNQVNKALPAALVKFIQKFSPPQDLQKLIEENKAQILERRFGTLECLPGLYFKSDHIDRVINAYRMKEFLKRNNITTLQVPEKYVYKLDEKIMVFVEAIQTQPIKCLDLKEVQDLVFFAQETGYVDFHTGNLVRNAQTGKLIIIDTENRSFHYDRLGCLVNFYASFSSRMTPDALAWVYAQAQELGLMMLPFDRSFDAQDDNFAEITANLRFDR